MHSPRSPNARRLDHAPLVVLTTMVAIVLYPRDAHAWGPVAHLDVSLQILAGASTIAAAVGELISRHRLDFLYGSLAADSVVGKNLARESAHCHAWPVASTLLEAARRKDEEYEAFMLGYLGHLGADVVAHNSFVPERLVSHYSARGIGHLYWEVRFDQQLLKISPQISETWHSLKGRRFEKHHRFLAKHLKPTVFSHRISSQLYRGSLGVQQRKPWQRALTHIDRRSRLPLDESEVERWRVASIALAMAALDAPMSPELAALDPTGRRAISTALRHRRLLRRRRRQKHSA